MNILKTRTAIPDWGKVDSKLPILIRDIANILNAEGIDNALCVPDFILAEMLVENLRAFARLNERTIKWCEE